MRRQQPIEENNDAAPEGYKVPALLPRGHFKALAQMANSSDEEVPSFVPVTVPPGTLNASNLPKEGDRKPLIKPEMVDHGEIFIHSNF